MKVATIVPQNYLHLTKNDDYFMCLGNLINKPGMEKYTDFFRQRSEEGKYVIMDNGLIEGDQRPITELLEKAKAVGAAEMILTDVFCDCTATLDAIERDMQALEGLEHPYLMVVPQGATLEEWVTCAHQLVVKYGSRVTYGVPKVLVKLGGRDGRIAALYRLLEECPIARHATFHLLGCWNSPIEVTMIAKLSSQDDVDSPWPRIRGVDSALPFVFARAGVKLNASDRPDSNPINFEKTKVSGALLRRNIRLWRKAGTIRTKWFKPWYAANVR